MSLCPTPGKASYPTQGVAWRRMLEILARAKAWERPDVPARVYACSCGAWHLTHKDPDPRAPRTLVEARNMLHYGTRSMAG